MLAQQFSDVLMLMLLYCLQRCLTAPVLHIDIGTLDNKQVGYSSMTCCRRSSAILLVFFLFFPSAQQPTKTFKKVFRLLDGIFQLIWNFISKFVTEVLFELFVDFLR